LESIYDGKRKATTIEMKNREGCWVTQAAFVLILGKNDGACVEIGFPLIPLSLEGRVEGVWVGIVEGLG